MKKFIFILFLILSLGFVIGAESDFVYILKVDSYSTYPSSIYPNSEVSLNITLENISELSDATDIVATLYPNPAYFEEIRNTDTLDIIKPQNRYKWNSNSSKRWKHLTP